MIESSRTATFPLVQASRVVEEETGRGLPGLMLELVDRLTRSPGRRLEKSALGTVHRYRDQDFDYVEIALNGIDDVDADICIHDGRIFVRIVR